MDNTKKIKSDNVYRMDPELFVSRKIADISDNLEKITEVLGELPFDELSVLKGENGMDGQSIQGLPGRDGIDGTSPVKGVDYYTEDEIEDMVVKATKRIRIPRDGKNGSPDTANEIANKLNSLENAIDPKVIKGGADAVANMVKGKLEAKDIKGLPKYYQVAGAGGGSSGGGTVTGVSVTSANGLAGTSDGSPVSPAITLSTTITGLVKANGTAFSAAVSGTDYLAPNVAITAATKTKITYDANGFVTAGTDATAADITNVPAGNIAATNVQTAINELDTEKAGLAINNTFTGANSFTGGSITVPTPVSGTDAVTKDYADQIALGTKYKSAVAAATTANITLSGEQTIDGTLTSTSRVLVKDQTDMTENGIYVSAAGAWSRATDSDTGTELEGASVFVDGSGGTNSDTLWTCSTTPITIGVTNIEFVKIGPFNGIASVGTIGAVPNANGATVTGTVLNLEPASATFGGVVTTGTQSFAGAKTIPSLKTTDSTFFIQDDGDATKQVQFQASGLTTATTRTLTVPDADLTITGIATTQTLTNKRITKRVSATATNATTYTLNTDNFDVFHITAQTATITSITTTGTPVDGDTLRISITGTATVPFTLNTANFEASTVSLGTTTSSTARLDMGFIYNSETSKFRQVAQA